MCWDHPKSVACERSLCLNKSNQGTVGICSDYRLCFSMLLAGAEFFVDMRTPNIEQQSSNGRTAEA